MTALSLWRLERTKRLRVTLVLRHGLKLALQKAETEQKDRIAPKENYIGAFGQTVRHKVPLAIGNSKEVQRIQGLLASAGKEEMVYEERGFLT